MHWHIKYPEIRSNFQQFLSQVTYPLATCKLIWTHTNCIWHKSVPIRDNNHLLVAHSEKYNLDFEVERKNTDVVNSMKNSGYI